MIHPMRGDFAVVPISGFTGLGIRLGQWLNGDGFRDFEHAVIYLGDGQVIEAMPGGAIRASFSGEWTDRAIWSTGYIALTPGQRSGIVASALEFMGTPYSFLDYLGLALARFGLRPRWLKRYIASTGHMICSQLVDQCYQDAGVQLFDDGRIPGDVTPADLANLIFDRAKENNEQEHGRVGQ